LVLSRQIVSPARRREGFGEALLSVAAGYAYEQGVLPVLDVAHHNVAAIRLYERLGWRWVGELEIDVGERTKFL
jgi:ribosomal protein S18 acetylase RimI-like enzyme